MLTLKQQIANMIRNEQDWIPDPVGIDTDVYAVVNQEGEAWLMAHNGECDVFKFTAIRRITE